MDADHHAYSILNDPRATAGTRVTLALPGQTPVEEAADVLDEVFRTQPGLSVIAVRVGADTAAVTSRARVRALRAPQRDPGAGDGATLPGESHRYRLLRLRCAVCGAEELHLHLDPDAPPSCPHGHGALVRTP
ncbi:MAG TPA: hypothetical protein VJT31_07675 [Rugosimonospora sp.]|nr:hypothetical protein [Rugosimonospora sp.]